MIAAWVGMLLLVASGHLFYAFIVLTILVLEGR